MRSSTICLILSCLAASLMAEPQQYHFAYPSYYPTYIPNQQLPYFRSEYSYPSMTDAAESAQDSRFLFATVTLTLATTTSTSTTTATTTCTTSTAALVTCSAGRRRRGLIFNGINKEGRGLFYDDNQEESETFLPESKNVDEAPAVALVEEKARNARETPLVPIFIQPGFNTPDSLRSGRLMLAFATSTVKVTATATSTATLIAICSSTTSFSTCAASGK